LLLEIRKSGSFLLGTNRDRRDVHSAVAESLRRQTRPSHTRVETKLDLLDPGLDTETLRSAVACLHSFWLGAEAGVASWAREHPALAARLDWSRRRRADLLAADLRLLGGIPAASAVVWTSHPTTADVLGWLYVAEGSTLGGAVIARHLRAIPAVRDRPLRSFTPYTEGPGPMWRAYLVELAEWTGVDEGRISAVVLAGVRIFDALDAWCDQFVAEVAA
jgi:heme oxygenase (biliverdin-IX-beta and delta-forming)